MGNDRIAVVGGGIVGLSIGFELLNRGHGVRILDSKWPGSGASSAANGALTPYSDDSVSQAVVTLAEESVDQYPDRLERIRSVSGLPLDQDACGVLEVFRPAEVSHGRSRFEAMLGKGWPVEWLDRDQVSDLEPNVARDLDGGLFYKSESRIDVDQYLAAIISAVRLSGGVLASPVSVYSVERVRSGMIRVRSDLGEVDFDHVIVACGSGKCRIVGGPTVPIQRVKGEIVEVLCPPDLLSRPLYRGDSFITPRRDGRMLLGTNYEPHQEGMSESRTSASAQAVLRHLQSAIEILPGIGLGEVSRTWKGWRPATLDGCPALGASGVEGVHVALGFGGLGFTTAARVSQLIADLVEGVELPNVFNDFAPTRFSSQV